MKKTIRDLLQGKIPEEDLHDINRSFEVVGDIAITEIKEEHQKYEKEIGEAILKINKSIKTVLKKDGIHGGEFRTQKLTYIAGENKKETIYTENGIRLCLNPETVYFSSKLSTERGELLSEIEDDSRVLIFFSGCGPYSFVTLKKNPDVARITSIELNPEGHKYALKSLELNKNIIKKSELYQNLKEFILLNQIPFYEKGFQQTMNNLMFHFINGDVREEAKKLKLTPKSISFNNNDNKIFETNDPKHIFETLKNHHSKEIYIDFDLLKDPEDLVPFIVLFAEDKDFIVKKDNTVYSFKSFREKSLLINYLQNEQKIPLEEIGEYDEIFMPLPKDAEQFLDSAFECVAKNGVIHLYGFLHENDFPHVIEDSVIQAGKKHAREIEILQTRKVGQYAPGKYRVCCDFIVR
jgi:tRNA G37 N-methylase Trm5